MAAAMPSRRSSPPGWAIGLVPSQGVLRTGTDAPVSNDSSIDRLRQDTNAASAATRSPSDSTRMSPRTTSRPRMGAATILSLGHPSPLLVRADGGVSPLPTLPVPPLGTVHWPMEQPLTAALPDGWRLLFYTDGLIEGRARLGSPERFGERRLIDAVRHHVTGPVGEDDLDRLIREVEAAGGAPFDDDVAVLLVSAAGRLAAESAGAQPPEGVLAGAG